MAADNGRVDCMALLIKAGGSLDAKNSAGLTAGRLAEGRRYVDCVQMIEAEQERRALAAEISKPSGAKPSSVLRV